MTTFNSAISLSTRAAACLKNQLPEEFRPNSFSEFVEATILLICMSTPFWLIPIALSSYLR